MDEINNLIRLLIVKILELPDENASESEINEWIFLTNILILLCSKKNFSQKRSDRDQ